MKLATLICAAAMTVPSVCGAATVLFSSFEGDLGVANATGNLYKTYNAGRVIEGWTVGGAGVDQITAPGYSPAPYPDGTKALDLNALNRGSISRLLETVIGSTYAVSFYLAGNGVTGTVGTNPGSLVFTGSSSAWVQKSFNFVATTTSTELSFAALTPNGSGGVTIDAILVTTPDLAPTPIPLPAASSAGLMLGMGLMGRRTRR